MARRPARGATVALVGVGVGLGLGLESQAGAAPEALLWREGLVLPWAAVPAAEPGRRISSGKSGELAVVPGRSAVVGRGPVLRYLVEVEGGLRLDRKVFAATVERILADRRGWRRGSRVFRRVASGPVAFRIALASPATTDRLCYPLPTNGTFSCASGYRAVLNLRRWRRGASSYRGRLRLYRVYMVNHEVGHVLGHSHGFCPRSGATAPVMMQQTKGVAPCRANPWPLPVELP